MAQTPYHIPVMTAEVVELMSPVEHGVIVDATFGGGGHTRALLDAMPEIEVIAVDRDPDAAPPDRAEPRLRFEAANFADLDQVLARLVGTQGRPHERGHGAGVAPGVAGVLFDLGVSSHQLDAGERGFSYRQAGPLDMRMDPNADLDASTIVNLWDQRDLADVIRRYGEERHAGRVARAIVEHRPITDTIQLADVVANAIPHPARRRRHPARKTFQALRIAVNDELAAVERGLEAAIEHVRPGGRIIVISYHSLEDRIVKRRFAAGAAGCVCPPDLPVCACGKVAELRSLTRKPLRPTEAEVTSNPRSRSARLRAVERVA